MYNINRVCLRTAVVHVYEPGSTYFTAAISRLVGEHVVVNFSNWWLPGNESAAMIHFTGCQVQGCVHGYRKERGKKKQSQLN